MHGAMQPTKQTDISWSNDYLSLKKNRMLCACILVELYRLSSNLEFLYATDRTNFLTVDRNVKKSRYFLFCSGQQTIDEVQKPSKCEVLYANVRTSQNQRRALRDWQGRYQTECTERGLTK
jgi:hypothetical protein